MGIFSNVKNYFSNRKKKKEEEQRQSSSKTSTIQRANNWNNSYKQRVQTNKQRQETIRTDRENKRQENRQNTINSAREGQASANRQNTNKYTTNTSYNTSSYYGNQKPVEIKKELSKITKEDYDKNKEHYNNLEFQYNQAAKYHDSKKAAELYPTIKEIKKYKDQLFDENKKQYNTDFENAKKIKAAKKAENEKIADKDLRKAANKKVDEEYKTAKRERGRLADENWTENGNAIQKTLAKGSDFGVSGFERTMRFLDAFSQTFSAAGNVFVDGEDDDFDSGVSKVAANYRRILNNEEKDKVIRGEHFYNNIDKNGNTAAKLTKDIAGNAIGAAGNTLWNIVKSPYDIGSITALEETMKKNGDMVIDFDETGNPIKISDKIKQHKSNYIVDGLGMAKDLITNPIESIKNAKSYQKAPLQVWEQDMLSKVGLAENVTAEEKAKLNKDGGFMFEFLDPIDLMGLGFGVDLAKGAGKAVNMAKQGISSVDDIGTLLKYTKEANRGLKNVPVKNIDEIAELLKTNKILKSENGIGLSDALVKKQRDILGNKKFTSKNITPEMIQDVIKNDRQIVNNANLSQNISNMSSKVSDYIKQSDEISKENISKTDLLFKNDTGREVAEQVRLNQLNRSIKAQEDSLVDVLNRGKGSSMKTADYQNAVRQQARLQEMKNPEFQNWAAKNIDEARNIDEALDTYKAMKAGENQVNSMADTIENSRNVFKKEKAGFDFDDNYAKVADEWEGNASKVIDEMFPGNKALKSSMEAENAAHTAKLELEALAKGDYSSLGDDFAKIVKQTEELKKGIPEKVNTKNIDKIRKIESRKARVANLENQINQVVNSRKMELEQQIPNLSKTADELGTQAKKTVNSMDDVVKIFDENPAIQENAKAINVIDDMVQSNTLQNPATRELADMVRKANEENIAIAVNQIQKPARELSVMEMLDDNMKVRPEFKDDFINSQGIDEYRRIMGMADEMSNTSKIADDVVTPVDDLTDGIGSIRKAANEAEELSQKGLSPTEMIDANFSQSYKKGNLFKNTFDWIRGKTRYDSGVPAAIKKVDSTGKVVNDKITPSMLSYELQNFDNAVKELNAAVSAKLDEAFKDVPKLKSKKTQNAYTNVHVMEDLYEDLQKTGIRNLNRQVLGLDLEDVIKNLPDNLTDDVIEGLKQNNPELVKLFGGDITREKILDLPRMIEKAGMDDFRTPRYWTEKNVEEIIEIKKQVPKIYEENKGVKEAVNAYRGVIKSYADEINQGLIDVGLPPKDFSRDFYFHHSMIIDSDDITAMAKSGGGIGQEGFLKKRYGSINYDTNPMKSLYDYAHKAETMKARLKLFKAIDNTPMNKTDDVVQKSYGIMMSDLKKTYDLDIFTNSTTSQSEMINAMLNSEKFINEVFSSKDSLKQSKELKAIINEFYSSGLKFEDSVTSELISKQLADELTRSAIMKMDDKMSEVLTNSSPKGYQVYRIDTKIETGLNKTENVLEVFQREILKKAGVKNINDFEYGQLNKLNSVGADNIDNAFSGLRIYSNEAIDTINKRFKVEKKSKMEGFNKITSAMKWWLTSGNPLNAYKFHIKNALGDTSAMLNLNMSSIKDIPGAERDLIRFRMTGQIPDYVDSVEEFRHVINELQGATATFENAKDFEKMIFNENDMSAIYNTYQTLSGQKLGQHREVAWRLASYRNFKRKLDNGKIGMYMYGATDANTVRAMRKMDISNSEMAIRLANDINGNYNNLSETGQYLRKFAIPFFSYMEANFKRYSNAIKNGLDWSVAKDIANMRNAAKGKGAANVFQVGSQYVGQASKRMAGLTATNGLLYAWNSLFGDEVNEDIQRNMPEFSQGGGSYLIANAVEDKNGELQVLYFNEVDTFTDYLSWMGASEWFNRTFNGEYETRETMRRETLTTGEKVKEYGENWAKGLANRFIQGSNPIAKTSYELFTGESLFPDFFDRQEITDKKQHIANAAGFNNIYKVLTEEPGYEIKEPKDILKLFNFANKTNITANLRGVYRYDARPELKKAMDERDGIKYREKTTREYNNPEYEIENKELNKASRDVAVAVEKRLPQEEIEKRLDKWYSLYKSTGNLKAAADAYDAKVAADKAKYGKNYNPEYTLPFNPYYPIETHLSSRNNMDYGFELQDYQKDNYINKGYQRNSPYKDTRDAAIARDAKTEKIINDTFFRDEFLTDYEKKSLYENQKYYKEIQALLNNSTKSHSKKIYR